METTKITYDLTEKMRIDKFLALQYPDYARNTFQKIIRDGQCLVNNRTVKANYICSTGDIILLTFPEQTIENIEPENIPLDIVYEEEDFLIINKPRDMVVHPAPGHSSGTLVNALMYHYNDNLSAINGAVRPGIVHRIDKDTTGLLLVAKTDAFHEWAAAALKEHKIVRRYEALVHNSVKEDKGTIANYLNRAGSDRKKYAVSTEGKWAVTHYEVLERLKQGQYSYVSCFLETGRTHQIRVHLAHIGNPVVGDKVYGPKKSAFHLEGQLLHARELFFTHPYTGEEMHFHSELPADFKNILTALQNYDNLF